MRRHIAFLLCWSCILCLTTCGRTQICAGVPPYSGEAGSSGTAPELKGSMVDGGSLAYTAKVAYANASGDTRILSEALNADLMYMSSVQHLPIYKFETESELQGFKNTFADALTFDHSYDEVPSFDQYAEEYDDVFFERHTLILCYVHASSGSYRYGIADISIGEDSLCVYVKQINHPQVCTADVQGWFVLAEVSKADIENCSRFDAQMTYSNVLDTITDEPEYHVCTYSNLTGKQGKEKTLSEADNQAVMQLIGRQDFGDPYDNLNDVILTDVLNEENIYYDSGAGILTWGDSAVKLSDADRETLNGIMKRYIQLGVE